MSAQENNNSTAASASPQLRSLLALATSLFSHHSLDEPRFPGQPGATLPVSRRIRAQRSGRSVLDTLGALYVWEHEYYPAFWVPEDDLTKDVVRTTAVEGGEVLWEGWKVAEVRKLEIVGEERRGEEEVLVLCFERKKGILGELAGMMRIEFGKMDEWYDEDAQIHIHPKDPTKRIFVLPSTRPLRISLNGRLLAAPRFYYRLIEPRLPVRFYIPRALVDLSPESGVQLRPSATKTLCPYKGEAEYFDIVFAGGEVHRDLVWYYRYPTNECREIEGCVCFYNEKVDVEEDGVAVERPKSKFASSE